MSRLHPDPSSVLQPASEHPEPRRDARGSRCEGLGAPRTTERAEGGDRRLVQDGSPAEKGWTGEEEEEERERERGGRERERASTALSAVTVEGFYTEEEEEEEACALNTEEEVCACVRACAHRE